MPRCEIRLPTAGLSHRAPICVLSGF
jgi:hypothetical protein